MMKEQFETLSMKWSRNHVLTWGYRRDLMVIVDLYKLKVIKNISSGSVVMKIKKSVFQEGHLTGIFEVGSGQNLVCRLYLDIFK
jgi:hypothetical protein